MRNDVSMKRRLRELVREELSRMDLTAIVHEVIEGMDFQAIVQAALHGQPNMSSIGPVQLQQRVLH